VPRVYVRFTLVTRSSRVGAKKVLNPKSGLVLDYIVGVSGLEFTMQTIAVVGASSSIARTLVDNLKSAEVKVIAYSRKDLGQSTESVEYIKVDDYTNLDFPSNVTQLVVCNGFFGTGPIVSFDSDQIKNFFLVNLEIPTIVIRRFLETTSVDMKRDIFVFGSAAAYDMGASTALYSSAKAGLRALVVSLNNEFRETETKFSLISTGTVKNEMGSKVPSQDPETLIDLQDLAEELARRILHFTNFFEPEIVIRRRRMQLHK
jgi:short-subunit dehydrogenase